MTFFIVENTSLDNRLYSVTGAFDLALIIACFYQLSGHKTMQYFSKLNTFRRFVVGVNRGFINLHPGITTLIPIDPSPELNASQHPAVSSLEAYPTPAR